MSTSLFDKQVFVTEKAAQVVLEKTVILPRIPLNSASPSVPNQRPRTIRKIQIIHTVFCAGLGFQVPSTSAFKAYVDVVVIAYDVLPCRFGRKYRNVAPSSEIAVHDHDFRSRAQVPSGG
jgi:hypothetical protein